MHVGANADLIDDREYAAPPELVFQVWTRAEHFARWFGPDNAEMLQCEIDARPGGVIRFQHRWPEGPLISIRGVFNEVVAPTRLSFTFTFVDANDHPTVNAMMPEWPVGAHIVMTVELVATARGPPGSCADGLDMREVSSRGLLAEFFVGEAARTGAAAAS